MNNTKQQNIKDFNRIDNILYSDKYHIQYENWFLNHDKLDIQSPLLSKELERINLSKEKLPTNPKYLFLVLCYNEKKNTIMFDILNSKSNSAWEFCKMNIINVKYNLYLNIDTNKKLILSKKRCKWEIVIINNKTFIKNKKRYLAININYEIYLTKDINEALCVNIQNNLIYYVKPYPLINFEINNLKLGNFSMEKINEIITNNKKNKINIGILLAGGTSTRFKSNTVKQLYILNGNPIISYSINVLSNMLDKLIIISNTQCYDEIKQLTTNCKNCIILINDINCRLESISVGLHYIKENITDVKNVLIHDSCRPHINKKLVKKLLDICNKYVYSQYYLKLVNGLYKKDSADYEMVDREHYIELTTPLCMNYELCHFIYNNYMHKDHRIVWEYISILDLLKIKYKMFEGNRKCLKKITTIDDV